MREGLMLSECKDAAPASSYDIEPYDIEMSDTVTVQWEIVRSE